MKSLCPICRKALPTEEHTGPFPFCSSRCKKVDLYRWLNEEYRISEAATPETMLDLQAAEAFAKDEAPN